jgi:cytochrome oxidase Cu insertion factor (SCO1/SenC/PrrC family)
MSSPGSRRVRATRLLAVAAPIVLGVGALAVWALGGSQARAPGGTDLEQLGIYGTVPYFSLVERSGRQVTRDDLEGTVSVVDFIYTHCTDTCPTQSAELSRLQREFRDSGPLRLVSITVDPAHDTPEVLTGYAARFDADHRWWFLTGSRQEISCLALEGFRLPFAEAGVTERPACGRVFRLAPAAAWASHGSAGLVLHSPRVSLVDRALRIRAYHLATEPDSMARLRTNLRRLLDERG